MPLRLVVGGVVVEYSTVDSKLLRPHSLAHSPRLTATEGEMDELHSRLHSVRQHYVSTYGTRTSEQEICFLEICVSQL